MLKKCHLSLAGAPEAAQWAAAHSQAPKEAAKQQQRRLEAACRFDTPLPIWCMKLPLAPCPSHEREMQVRVGSGAHWNSHGKFDFRLGKVQLACAPSCARAGGSRCHRRAADGRRGAFNLTALQLTLRAAAAWTLRGRRVGVAASCTLACLQIPTFHSLDVGRTATRGAKLFTWNWSPLATSVVQPSRRSLDRAEVTSHVPLSLQK